MEIGCANSRCAFGSGRPLPVLTVDEAIYRRLPAFLIATVDKFAGLPFIDKVGAFLTTSTARMTTASMVPPNRAPDASYSAERGSFRPC